MRTVKDVTYDLLRKLELTTIVGNPGSTEETFLKNFPAPAALARTAAEVTATVGEALHRSGAGVVVIPITRRYHALLG
jgi:hypothetical protein